MNAFEKKLKAKIDLLTHGKLGDFTPSLQIAVIVKGKLKGQLKLGRPAKYFDLASLTKIIFGVSQMMVLEEAGLLSHKDLVKKHWPEFPFNNVRLRDLLTHTAGFRAWAPYYKKLKHKISITDKRELLRKILLSEKRSNTRSAVYSDIDFLILSVVFENILQLDLNHQWNNLRKSLGLNRVHFSIGNQRLNLKTQYAPTEKCPWRKKHLHGEVHDDNTWSLGGVSTHAGLFGSLGDVVKYTQLLRGLYYRGSKLISKGTAGKYMSRSLPRSRGDWALGFMMPSKEGSSAGLYFSQKSIGHTGFTGTSVWFDPEADIAVVILSNRVSPTRDNLKFRFLRPHLHDAVRQILGSEL